MPARARDSQAGRGRAGHDPGRGSPSTQALARGAGRNRSDPTFGDAIDQWLRYLELEKRRKSSTVQDARNVARAYLLPRFGADTPLCSVERHEVLLVRGGRQVIELRQDREDTFSTDDVDEFRRDLLASHLAPRSVQKILVLLHGVFKLAKRRRLIDSNPLGGRGARDGRRSRHVQHPRARGV